MVCKILIGVIIALLLILFVIWQIKKKGLRSYIIECIVFAEKNFNDGRDKFNSVVDSVIEKLPFPFNMIPVSFIENLVQTIFNEVKIALDYKNEGGN